jgi:hypothetical protein
MNRERVDLVLVNNWLADVGYIEPYLAHALSTFLTFEPTFGSSRALCITFHLTYKAAIALYTLAHSYSSTK